MSTCTDYASDIYSAYEYAESRMGFFLTNYNALTENLHATNITLFITRLKNCLINNNIAIQALMFGNTGYTEPKRIPYMMVNCLGGSLEMSDIINTMLRASFDELQSFIGIEDAYRIALWNAPFNAEFYSALARGFQKWP